MNDIPITIGSDPELCIYDTRLGRIRSAIPVLEGLSKYERLNLGDGFEVFPDNVNIEFTIPPAGSADELVDNFRHLYNKADAFLKDKDCSLAIVAAHNFPDEDLLDEGAMSFGCQPEIIVYPDESGTFIEYDRPSPEQIGNLRVCGGHIHVGRADFKTCEHDAWLIDPWSKVKCARAMDLFVGIPLTLLDTDPTSTIRKQLYGKAGSIRYELPYGYEYRTLSNFWIAHEVTIRLVHKLTCFAVNYAQQNQDIFESSNQKVPFNTIREAIDTGNKEDCLELMMASDLPQEVKDEVLALLSAGVTHTGKGNL